MIVGIRSEPIRLILLAPERIVKIPKAVDVTRTINQ